MGSTGPGSGWMYLEQTTLSLGRNVTSGHPLMWGCGDCDEGQETYQASVAVLGAVNCGLRRKSYETNLIGRKQTIQKSGSARSLVVSINTPSVTSRQRAYLVPRVV